MPFLNKCLHVLIGFMMLSLGLWLVTAFVDRYDHSGLLRAGLLALGLCTIVRGLRRNEGQIVAIGLLLLAVSILCFHMNGPNGGSAFISRLSHQSGVGHRLWRRVSLPLQWHFHMPVGYTILGIWLVVNAMMFAHRVPPRTIISANLIFLVSVALMHFLWPC